MPFSSQNPLPTNPISQRRAETLPSSLLQFSKQNYLPKPPPGTQFQNTSLPAQPINYTPTYFPLHHSQHTNQERCDNVPESVQHAQQSHHTIPINGTPSASGPSFTLSKQDISILSQTYADTLSLPRNSLVASQWLFNSWALTPSPTLEDAINLDLSRSRGYRTLYVCTSRDCNTFNSHSILQNSATLLLPVKTNDPLILGYFIDSSGDHTQSTPPRVGKYVYCSDSQQMVKVSKIRGPLSASSYSSVLIQKTALVSRTILVNDYVMASFPWFDGTNFQPFSHYIVHSRTLSFHVLTQTAQRAGFVGYFDDVPLSSANNEARYDDLGILENSFFGVGPFGIYDASIVPCKFPPGARSDGISDFTPHPAFGIWAVPEHLSVCRGFQTIHLGLTQGESASLQAQFVHAFGHVSLPSRTPSQVDAEQTISNPFTREQGGIQEEEHYLRDHGDDPNQTFLSKRQLSLATNQEDERIIGGSSIREVTLQSSPLASIFEGQEGCTGHAECEETMGEAAKIAMKDKHTMLAHGQVFTRGAGAQGVEVLNQEASASLMIDSVDPVLPIPRDSSSVVPISKPVLGFSSGFASRRDHESGVAQRTDPPDDGAAPPTCVATVPLQIHAAPTSEGVGFIQSPIVMKGIAPAVTGFPSAPESTATKDDNSGVGSKLVKKTLPAPTRNEIVIRNRISAQRSNEKRRRKIEATKSELAFLKTTYLPQLEHRRVALVTENQSLRISFMEKYQQDVVETFF